jgi:myo-inositol-1(or 4)-monophosphatase
MTDIELICNAALEAGRLALTLRDRGLIISHKADGSPVTNGDLAVDALLKAQLGSARLWLVIGGERRQRGPCRL